MNVLITGGAGFIGSHIANAVLERGWNACVVDNLSAGRRENVPNEARFEEVDIRDVEKLTTVFDSFKPDLVCHQAAQASVAVSVREPNLDADININGTLNLLNLSAKSGVQRILFASTGGAIYGEVPDGTRASLQTAPNPLSPYACSKFACEAYLNCFRHEHGLNHTILRYANVYGPRQDPHGEAGVVAIFMNRLLAGESIRINARREPGDAGCVRDYVYVGDVVKANMAAMEGRLPESILNVATGVDTTTKQLADLIAARLGVQAEIGFGPLRPGDVERSVLDPANLSDLIGGITSLNAGLADTAQWFQKHAAK